MRMSVFTRFLLINKPTLFMKYNIKSNYTYSFSKIYILCMVSTGKNEWIDIDCTSSTTPCTKVRYGLNASSLSDHGEMFFVDHRWLTIISKSAVTLDQWQVRLTMNQLSLWQGFSGIYRSIDQGRFNFFPVLFYNWTGGRYFFRDR